MIHNLTAIFESELLESIDPGSIASKKYEGWYGTVYKIQILNNTYALKCFKPIMHKEVADGKLAAYDYDILKSLTNSRHYPTLHAYKEGDWMLTDWIEGAPFRTIENKSLYFSQLHNAYLESVNSGWFPDDVKGDNLVCSNGTIMIIDVGSYLPVKEKVVYLIDERVNFLIRHAHIYPSVRDQVPYRYKQTKQRGVLNG